MRAFGHERDLENCPVPTVIPSMGLVLTPQQMKSVTVRNGFAMEDAKGRWLGGAEGFAVKWHGALLIDEEGEYRFRAGAPAREDEEPSCGGGAAPVLEGHSEARSEDLDPAASPLAWRRGSPRGGVAAQARRL